MEQLKEEHEEQYRRVAEERNSVNEELNELFAEKSEKDVIIKTLTSENLELSGKISALEQLLCAKEDADSKADEIREAYRALEQLKDKFKSDLELCTNYLLEVEEKCQEAQKTSLELLQQLKEREFEIERLHEVIVQLQKG